jgi:lysozyme family protein
MKDNFNDSLNHVLSHEGGYVDHPRDPGGATNKGVTLKVFRAFYGEHLGKDDLRQLSVREAGAIYKKNYWDKCRCDDLPAGVDYAVFDQAVNSGPSRSSKWLQRAVGVSADGAIGAQTLAAVAAISAEITVKQMCDERLAFLQGLRNWEVFGNGWGRRVDEVRTKALVLSGGTPLTTPDAEVASFEILRTGASGEQVRELQEALNHDRETDGREAVLTVDGDFGLGTEAALIEFQSENGLEADGIAGHNTCQALGLI